MTYTTPVADEHVVADAVFSRGPRTPRTRFTPGPTCLACGSDRTRLTRRRRVVVCRDCEIHYFLPAREVTS